MATTITLDPTTRLEGHLKVEVQSDAGKITSAKSSGLMFRGFENLLVGKEARDAAVITQRVCGVCPISHAMSACLAAEQAANITIPDNARHIRNLILGANTIQSHILHFYHLSLLSYVKGPDMPPWTPGYTQDMRLDSATNNRFVQNYLSALNFRRTCHEMAAIFGGKLPHTAAFEFGGVTTIPTKAQVDKFRTMLADVTNFVNNVYLPDANLLGQKYPDYFNVGKGYGNLLSFGVYDQNASGASKLFSRGRVVSASTNILSVDVNSITEQAKFSWYNDSSSGQNPSNGVTSPNADKAGAYSWLKAPRYGGVPYETGPLARMWVTGHYRRGISVMDRHLARANEAKIIAQAMSGWLSAVNLGASFYTQFPLNVSGSGIGLTEAARGALGHWVKISGGKVAAYQIVTPTCWNCSPRDNNGLAGPLEKALEGTPVANAAQPVEVMRVVQSYDPCVSCSVH